MRLLAVGTFYRAGLIKLCHVSVFSSKQKSHGLHDVKHTPDYAMLIAPTRVQVNPQPI
jgi:hypothetical protein